MTELPQASALLVKMLNFPLMVWLLMKSIKPSQREMDE